MGQVIKSAGLATGRLLIYDKSNTAQPRLQYSELPTLFISARSDTDTLRAWRHLSHPMVASDGPRRLITLSGHEAVHEERTFLDTLPLF